MSITIIGNILFGAVIGWMVHKAYWDMSDLTTKWIAGMLGVIGGGAITGLLNNGLNFSEYCVGLGIAFFLRMILFSPLWILFGEWFLKKYFGRTSLSSDNQEHPK